MFMGLLILFGISPPKNIRSILEVDWNLPDTMCRDHGLFTAPFPQDSDELERITKLFISLEFSWPNAFKTTDLWTYLFQTFLLNLCMGDIKSNMSKLIYESPRWQRPTLHWKSVWSLYRRRAWLTLSRKFEWGSENQNSF